MRILVFVALASVALIPSVAFGQNSITVDSVFGAPGNMTDAKVLLTANQEVAGYQVALRYDATKITLLEAELTGLAVGAELFITPTTVLFGEYAWGVLMDYLPPLDGNTIPAGTDLEVATLHCTLSPNAPVGTTALIDIVDGVGTPVIETLLILPTGFSTYPSWNSGVINIENYNAFVRGDCNGDDNVEIADCLFALTYLYSGGAAPTCNDACDANDDSALGLADAIYLLNYLFVGGPAPLFPFPGAGIDATVGDGIGCNGDLDDA